MTARMLTSRPHERQHDDDNAMLSLLAVSD